MTLQEAHQREEMIPQVGSLRETAVPDVFMGYRKHIMEWKHFRYYRYVETTHSCSRENMI